MHASSFENMERCIKWYLPDRPVRVVDLGSISVNGSYRRLFKNNIEYIGIDLEDGPGVEIVLDDPYTIPLADAYCDVVISGQMLEHCGQFWRVFTEIKRILKPGGIALIIAPSAGPIHRYPVDCYRFFPDAYQACADWVQLRLVHCWHDDRGPWRDLVGVFENGTELERCIHPKGHLPFQPFLGAGGNPSEECTSGQRHYLDVLRDIHAIARPEYYLEIGVRHGASLALARCKSIGIDPAPDLSANFDLSSTDLHQATSDDFFFFSGAQTLPPIDLAFIDGLHLCEFVFRDFMNIEPLMSRHGVIVIDDVFPNHPRQSLRKRETKVWTGDVWRFCHFLQTHRPDLTLTYLDTSPTGLLLISRLNPESTLLRDQYNPIMRALNPSNEIIPDAEWIGRNFAQSPSIEILKTVLSSN